jgi:beta-glucuronidase
VKHEFGHLPFEADITDVLKYGHENRITVLCDNVLIQTTIPQGKILEMSKDNGTEIVQKYTFDFFNYAGIHRSVYLYTTPITHISEVVVTTDISGTEGKVFYQVISNTNTTTDLEVMVKILDKNGLHVADSVASEDLKGIATIENVKPWWPYLMHDEPGYLYTIEVYLSTRTQKNCDIYRQKIGIRTLKWSNSSFTINGKPIYFRGFGRHEDSDVRKIYLWT